MPTEATQETSGSAGHPLGPLLLRTRPWQSGAVRRRAVVVGLGCSAILAMALYMTPAPGGIGTHSQLGLPPCTLWLTFGVPCPTCGMTTSFSHVVRGHLIDGLLTQPAGGLLAMMVMVAWLQSVYELVTGRGWRINWYRVVPWKVAVGGGLIILGAWLYKIVATRA